MDFQKALALSKLGDVEGSKNQLSQVMKLTEKNENVAQRASNYALMAALYDRQMDQVDSALVYLNKAKELDPGNVKYTLQEGDMYLTRGDYESAYAAYDLAAQMDPDSPLDVRFSEEAKGQAIQWAPQWENLAGPDL